MLVVIESLLTFTGLFFIVRSSVVLELNSKALADFQSRIVSGIHGLFCIWYSLTDILEGNDYYAPISNFEEAVISATVGYFIYDTIVMYIYDIYDLPIMLHHISLVIFFPLILLYGDEEGPIIMYEVFLMECTNPFLQTKELLRIANQKKTKVFLVVELIYYVFLFIFRYAIGIPLCITQILSARISVPHKALVWIFILIMLYWGVGCYRVVKLRYQQYLLRCEKNIDLPWVVSISSHHH